MIRIFNKGRKIENQIFIHKEFPKYKLIKIMRPYLELYCVSRYGYLNSMREITQLILKKKLIEFNKFNPQFGRKRYKILMKNTSDFKKKICGKIIEYNDTHIKFHENHDENYLSSHLNYNENFLMVTNNIIDHNFIIFVDENEYDTDELTNNSVNEENNSVNEENDSDNIDIIPEPTENTILRTDAEDELDDNNYNNDDDEDDDDNYNHNNDNDYDENEIDSIS
jgi:hypothetical protein